jgi:demethylmenaquinone methyltransferase/2-methoxy-6-polyprenyl-1,4-benzoquinol methylase
MSLLPDYSRQARTYDLTRAASPSVLAALRSALAGAPGPRLADIGGGTGNYAVALREVGWDPVVIDRSPEMLAHATRKGLETVTANATRLPLTDESVDAVMLVSMLHHVEDRPRALAEARRIVRNRGRLALMVYTREDIEDLWFSDYFPSTRTWMQASHPTLAELLELLPGAQHHPVLFTDLKDASLAALASHPEKVLDPAWRSQTSYFERLQGDHPHELSAGLRRLEDDVHAGRAPTRPGRASVLAWTKTS